MMWRRSNYSEGDVLRMQQDAINRVHEMQRRAQRTIEETNGSIRHMHNSAGHPHSPVEARGGAKAEPAAEKPHVALVPKSQNPLGSIFSALNLDGEQILIAVLLIVLINEGAQAPIIIALVYLLL